MFGCIADAAAPARPQHDGNASRWNTAAVEAALPRENKQQRVERFIKDNFAVGEVFTVKGIHNTIADISEALMYAPTRATRDVLCVSSNTVNDAKNTLQARNEIIVHSSKRYVLLRGMDHSEIRQLSAYSEVKSVLNHICTEYNVYDTFIEIDVIFHDRSYTRFTYLSVTEAVKILLRRGYLQVAGARSPREALMYSLRFHSL